ncbi:MAG TPA: hypothetical protein VIB11_08315 [Pedococcus sp.]|jgi:hypothetical protein|uniref:hypothetical protein n=1 Tax=Pedococcus sp. TaxID=2860345 RepID=UPI002F9353CE
MTEQPKDDEVPGGTLQGNEEGASSDGDSGPSGAAASSPDTDDARGDDRGDD